MKELFDTTGFYDKIRWNNYVPCKPRDPHGRNDKCPCGSGLKYKRCCLKSKQK